MITTFRNRVVFLRTGTYRFGSRGFGWDNTALAREAIQTTSEGAEVELNLLTAHP
jgi:beta-xylosidase